MSSTNIELISLTLLAGTNRGKEAMVSLRKTMDTNAPKQKNILGEILRTLWNNPEGRNELIELRRMLWKPFFWLVFTEIAFVLQIYPIKLIFDALTEQPENKPYVLGLSLLILVAYVGASLVHQQMDNYRNDFIWRFWAFCWGYGHRHALNLSTDWHVAHSTGEKESILAKNIVKAENLVDHLLFETIPMVLRVFFTSIGVWFLGWEYGVIALGTLAVFSVVLIANEKALAPLREHFRKQMKRIERDGTELIQNWRTIKQFGLEQEQGDEHRELLMRFWNDEKWRHRKFISLLKRQEHVVSLSRFVLIGTIAWLFAPGMSLGSAVLVTGWMDRIYSNLNRFSDFQRRLNEGLEAIKELVGMAQTVPSVRQQESPVWKKMISGEVEFRNVSFSYPSGKDDALRNISFAAKPNQTIALVGHSGSGKSTIASLLLREYDPTEGAILIDGIDMRELDYNRYRQGVVSVVSQDVQLFDATVGENIRIVKRDAPQGAEEEAAQKAYADEFIRELPQGYDTMIGEDGIRLSGGQRQRLALARALIRKPRILILDEATSSLDAISQQRVQQSIDELIARKECTLFVIAHRFSTIMSADLVIVLENGEIAEMGTHDQLNNANGIYKRLRDLETGL